MPKFVSIRPPKKVRGPLGLICGHSGVGKTTHGVMAFPEYLKIGFRDGSFQGPRAFAEEYRGLTMPYPHEDGVVWAPTRVANKIPYNFFEEVVELFEHLMAKGKSFHAKKGRPGLPRKNLFGNGQTFCNEFSGIYLADMTFLFEWAAESAKEHHGFSYDTNSLIQRTVELLMNLNTETGLGVIADFHWVAAKYRSESPKTGEKPIYRAGPDVPYGRMRESLIRRADFCVRIDEKKGKRYVNLAGDVETECLKITNRDKIPSKTDAVQEINEKFTFRDILNDHGYNLPDNPDLFSEGFKRDNPERFNQEQPPQ